KGRLEGEESVRLGQVLRWRGSRSGSTGQIPIRTTGRPPGPSRAGSSAYLPRVRSTVRAATGRVPTVGRLVAVRFAPALVRRRRAISSDALQAAPGLPGSTGSPPRLRRPP